MADDEKTPLPADKPDPLRPDPDEAAAGSQPDEGDPVTRDADEAVEEEAEEAIEEIEAEDEEPVRRSPPRPATASDVGFVEKAWEAQHRVEARFKKIGRGRYSRVIRMARKPEHEEFVRASQITAIGILVIGFLGFLILLFMGWLMGLLNIK